MAWYVMLSFGQPGNVPARDALDVPNHNLETLKIEDGACVEGDVEEDECPFEEGVDGVCYIPYLISQLFHKQNHKLENSRVGRGKE